MRVWHVGPADASPDPAVILPTLNAETSAFISYSRKDREFVQRLHAALAARGKSGWVDWEGIRFCRNKRGLVRSADEV